MKHTIVKGHMLPVWRSAEGYWNTFVRTITRQPRRTAMVGAVCAGLLLLVLTTTLPMALAPSSPGLAGRLNPKDPTVLMHAANQVRETLVGLERASSVIPPEGDASEGSSAPGIILGGKAGGVPVDTIARLPEAPPPEDIKPALSGPEIELLREEIIRRANAVIAVDPLNPAPFRMKAEVTEDPEHKRVLLLEAAKRSRRDPETLLLLIQDDLNNNRHDSALEQVDILLRSHPRFARPLFAIMAPLAEDADRRSILVQWLLRSPDWRNAFFSHLNRNITQADTPFLLMHELQQAGQPPSEKEINPYLAFLLRTGFPSYAYNVWVQTLPPEMFAHVGFLNNPSFEQAPTGSPFDWQMATPRNATGEFVPLRDLGGQRAFHVSFGSGRVRFPELSQTLALPPGRYRLEGKLKGSVVGKRGLVWQVQCYYRRNPPLGQTEQLLGQAQTWRMFGFDFQVPDIPECLAQTLRLFHDARSASEEVVSGEVWFDNLTLQRITE